MNDGSTVTDFADPREFKFTLAPGEIHVWRVRLELHDLRYRELELWLSEDERARAGRFVFYRDRARFVACRGRLRRILASYLGATPQQIEFRYEARGKPSLKPATSPPLFFNVSHSGNIALVALRRGGELGVDVEQLRPVQEAESIARRYFTPAEYAAITALPEEDRIAAFFRCWTRKEAMLKATGEGIGASLDAVEVDLEPDHPRVLSIRGQRDDEVAAWRLYHVAAGDAYLGAVAAKGDREHVVGWQWIDPP